MVTGWPVAALGLGALMALWPRLFGGSAAEARQIAELEALVVWVESLKDTIAGHWELALCSRFPITARRDVPIGSIRHDPASPRDAIVCTVDVHGVEIGRHPFRQR